MRSITSRTIRNAELEARRRRSTKRRTGSRRFRRTAAGSAARSSETRTSAPLCPLGTPGQGYNPSPISRMPDRRDRAAPCSQGTARLGDGRDAVPKVGSRELWSANALPICRRERTPRPSGTCAQSRSRERDARKPRPGNVRGKSCATGTRPLVARTEAPRTRLRMDIEEERGDGEGLYSFVV